MPKRAKSRVSVGLGFRVHSGWAAVVAVTGPASSPTVVDLRRIELADPAIRGSLQPFHAVAGLNLVAADEFIKRRADSTSVLALESLRRLINDLCQPGYQAIGSCIIVGSGRPLRTLESMLASHAMIHTAEGEFFREAIRRANETCGLPVTGIKEREILSRGAAELGLPLERISRICFQIVIFRFSKVGSCISHSQSVRSFERGKCASYRRKSGGQSLRLNNSLSRNRTRRERVILRD